MPNLNYAALAFGLALIVQVAGLFFWGATVEARTKELHGTTEPLRRGDLVAIKTDVEWIRAELERESRR
ncbi:MAG: hypothetical protein EON96_02685 [Caulobacteraceae bacterium]|nr:MAG: hypothetical protein EON96_02685 [Caulobacteraceae bacterium]